MQAEQVAPDAEPAAEPTTMASNEATTHDEQQIKPSGTRAEGIDEEDPLFKIDPFLFTLKKGPFVQTNQRWFWISNCRPLQRFPLATLFQKYQEDMTIGKDREPTPDDMWDVQFATHCDVAILLALEKAFLAIAQDPWGSSPKAMPKDLEEKIAYLLEHYLRFLLTYMLIRDDDPETWEKPVTVEWDGLWEDVYRAASKFVRRHNPRYGPDDVLDTLWKYSEHYLVMFRMGETDQIFDELARGRAAMLLFVRAADSHAGKYYVYDDSPEVSDMDDIISTKENEDGETSDSPDQFNAEKSEMVAAGIQKILVEGIQKCETEKAQLSARSTMWEEERCAIEDEIGGKPRSNIEGIDHSHMSWAVMDDREQHFYRLNPLPGLFPGRFSLRRSNELGRGRKRVLFDLIEATSRSDYENSSIGWNPEQKYSELDDVGMWFIIYHFEGLAFRSFNSSRDTIPAFLSFKIEYDDPPNEKYPVGYIYEVHVDEQLRGQGIGSYMLRHAERIIRATGIRKAMLTVFKSNQTARNLYGRLGYTRDACSPGKQTRSGFVEADYVILSKKLKSLYVKPLFDE